MEINVTLRRQQTEVAVFFWEKSFPGHTREKLSFLKNLKGSLLTQSFKRKKKQNQWGERIPRLLFEWSALINTKNVIHHTLTFQTLGWFQQRVSKAWSEGGNHFFFLILKIWNKILIWKFIISLEFHNATAANLCSDCWDAVIIAVKFHYLPKPSMQPSNTIHSDQPAFACSSLI